MSFDILTSKLSIILCLVFIHSLLLYIEIAPKNSVSLALCLTHCLPLSLTPPLWCRNLYCCKWSCEDQCCRQRNAGALPPVYCYNDLVVKNTFANREGKIDLSQKHAHIALAGDIIKLNNNYDVFLLSAPATTQPRFLQHTLLFFCLAIDRNLHWGRFIMECMTWFVSSLGWRPISLTSTRQILFDKSWCQGMWILSSGRYFVSWRQILLGNTGACRFPLLGSHIAMHIFSSHNKTTYFADFMSLFFLFEFC